VLRKISIFSGLRKLIGWPARSQLTVRNAYEAASSGRRLKIWRPGSIGPNAATLGDLSMLRDRSRQSIRDNGWIGHGVKNYVSNEIGCGIFPRSLV
jgi:capsid protein